MDESTSTKEMVAHLRSCANLSSYEGGKFYLAVAKRLEELQEFKDDTESSAQEHDLNV